MVRDSFCEQPPDGNVEALRSECLSHKGRFSQVAGMRAHQYPSDVTDEQWRLIPAHPGGRPRTAGLRDVVDAILCLLRTRCQWRFLPKDFPPKSTLLWGPGERPAGHRGAARSGFGCRSASTIAA